MPSVVFVVAALVAGAALAVQAAINGRLSLATGHPVTAGIISFLVGLACLLVGIVVFRIPLPRLGALGSLPVWGYAGGSLGAVYVALTILAVPRLGTAATVAFLVAGQMAASLVLDQLGVFGLPEHPINLWRVLGACLLTAGVVLMRVF